MRIKTSPKPITSQVKDNPVVGSAVDAMGVTVATAANGVMVTSGVDVLVGVAEGVMLACAVAVNAAAV